MTSFRALGPAPLVTLMKIERADAPLIDFSFLLYGGCDFTPQTAVELRQETGGTNKNPAKR